MSSKGELEKAEVVWTAYIANVAAYDLPFFWRGCIRLERKRYAAAAQDFFRSYLDGSNGIWTTPQFFSEILEEIEEQALHGQQMLLGNSLLDTIRDEMSALLKDDPGNLIARVIRTNVADQGGEQDNSIVEDLLKVSESSESLMPCCLLRQFTGEQESEWRRAARAYAYAIRLKPDCAVLYQERGKFYKRLGETGLAAQDREAVARLRSKT